MSDKPIERHVYDFLVEQIALLDDDDPLADIDLHRHTYRPFDPDKWYGLRISNATSDLAPNPGATEMEEFDGHLVLVPFARIKEEDYSDLETAVDKAFAIQKWVAQIFDSEVGVTLNGRVNDARVLKSARDFGEWDSANYAVANMPMLINDTGRE